jgi:ATP-binding cassette subfamily B protein
MGFGGMGGSMRHLRRDPALLNQTVRSGTARRMLKSAMPYAAFLGFYLLVVVLDAAVGIVNPLLYRNIINNGILRQNLPIVVKLASLIALLGLLDCFLGIVQSYLSASIGSRVVLALRSELFEHIQKLPIAFFMRVRTGALVSRLNADVNGAQTAFTDILSSVVGNIISAAMILAAMFFLCPQITVASLILFPIFLLPARAWGRKLQKTIREGLNLTSAMNGLMVERFNVSGALLVKLFGRDTEEVEAFATQAKNVSAIAVKRTVYTRLFSSALFLLSSFSTALALGWGGSLAVRHRLDVGTVIAFVSFLGRLYGPLTGLSNIQVNVMTALVSFERVFEVLDLVPLVQQRPNPSEIPSGPARISFEQVSFRYPIESEIPLGSLESLAIPNHTSNQNTLHDISFVVEPGSLVALVGPSGAGKTTISHLLARLYDVQSGSVAINGVDVRDLRLDAIRECVGIVTQDVHLFHETIRMNLLYAKPKATDSELAHALEASQLLPLIASLPDGLETLVGERGYRLSGGEKQRLAIARLILKSPSIVILDEATAHLDSESELAVKNALEIVFQGRTSLVIAHRLSTIVNADQILFINDGRIIERGTHAELLSRHGAYAELFRLQYPIAN